MTGRDPDEEHRAATPLEPGHRRLVTVIGYETIGHRHQLMALEHALGR
jgi:hypothetical protein